MGSRGKGDVDTGSNHLGFRCVQDAVAIAVAMTNGKETSAP
jgi:hypothetical protein